MRVHEEGDSLVAVAQLLGYAGNVSTVCDSDAGEGMPLWHNKDKSENPCVARSWRFVLILFPLKNGLEMGSTDRKSVV